jgi:hypothetical protein
VCVDKDSRLAAVSCCEWLQPCCAAAIAEQRRAGYLHPGAVSIAPERLNERHHAPGFLFGREQNGPRVRRLTADVKNVCSVVNLHKQRERERERRGAIEWVMVQSADHSTENRCIGTYQLLCVVDGSLDIDKVTTVAEAVGRGVDDALQVWREPFTIVSVEWLRQTCGGAEGSRRTMTNVRSLHVQSWERMGVTLYSLCCGSSLNSCVTSRAASQIGQTQRQHSRAPPGLDATYPSS